MTDMTDYDPISTKWERGIEKCFSDRTVLKKKKKGKIRHICHFGTEEIHRRKEDLVVSENSPIYLFITSHRSTGVNFKTGAWDE